MLHQISVVFTLLSIKVADYAASPLSLSPLNAASPLSRSGFFETFPDLSQQPQRCFTWEELRACRGVEGAPLRFAVDGYVYDVTEFYQYHPGGAPSLARQAGRDASAALAAARMPDYVSTRLLRRFRVGHVQSTCPAS